MHVFRVSSSRKQQPRPSCLFELTGWLSREHVCMCYRRTFLPPVLWRRRRRRRRQHSRFDDMHGYRAFVADMQRTNQPTMPYNQPASQPANLTVINNNNNKLKKGKRKRKKTPFEPTKYTRKKQKG